MPGRMPDGSEWPTVSIVTPSYDQGRYLEETIRSVLLQGYPRLEYLIVDGGSTDKSVEIIKQYEPFLAYWVSEKDNGQSHAINKGFARATGEIMGWLNSDDLLQQHACCHVANAFHRMPEADFVYGQCLRMDASSRAGTPMWVKEFSLRGHAVYGCVVPQPSCFWRRSAYLRIGPLREDLHFIMDDEYWRRAAVAGCAFARIDDVLSLFRNHKAQKTADFLGPLLEEKRRLLAEEAEDPAFPLKGDYFRRAHSELWRLESQARYRAGDRLGSARCSLRALFALKTSCRAADAWITGKWLTRLLMRH